MDDLLDKTIPGPFIFHEDGGHGWLEVPTALVMNLGCKISGYSYVRNDKMYLEEDCDADEFFTKFMARYNTRPTYSNQYDGDYSRIRSYRHYEGRT